jgi:hypothetical protein
MNRVRCVCATSCKVLAIFAVILTAAFFLCQKKPKLFDESRFALVDTIGGNYIFRGSSPFEDKDGNAVFAYEKLTTSINAILVKQGLAPLKDYHLVDYSLLDIDQYYVIQKEADFFTANPELGNHVNVSTISPRLLLTPFDSDIASIFVDSYNASITSLVENARALAVKQTDKPVVVFIHCNAGRDRTGFVVASYRMLLKNMTLKEAVARNVAETGRNSQDFYDTAIESYCRYLGNAGASANGSNAASMCQT